MKRIAVLTLVALMVVACGGSPTPTPDVVATLVAEELAVAATLTALAPTATATPLPTSTVTSTPTLTFTPTSTPTSSHNPTPQPTPTVTPIPWPKGTNGLIAFVSDRDGNQEIYIMEADGGAQTRLTTNDANDSEPAWSPDGKRIAFTSERDGNAEIYVMDANGSGQRNLTANAADDSQPQWLPDGKRIAFQSNRDGENKRYIINADGGPNVELRSQWSHVDTTVAPDGERFAFTGAFFEGDTEIFVQAINRQTRFTRNSANDSEPAWSPDGTCIAFTSERDGNAEIYVMPDYHMLEPRYQYTGQISLTHDLATDRAPTWSPDGERIAFQSDRDDNWEIYAMNADGSSLTRLTNNPAEDTLPAWSVLVSVALRPPAPTSTLTASAAPASTSTPRFTPTAIPTSSLSPIPNTIRGWVFRSDTGAPVPGAKVLLLSGESESPLAVVTASPDGRYSLSHISPGTYHLSVSVEAADADDLPCPGIDPGPGSTALSINPDWWTIVFARPTSATIVQVTITPDFDFGAGDSLELNIDMACFGPW